jgi:hypothetical protein
MADEEQTPQEPQEPQEPDVTAPAGDDEYEDILMSALKNIYNELEGEDEEDEGGEPKPPAKAPEEMTIDELRAAYGKTQETLKAVVQASLAEREEKNAIQTWNGFLETATDFEKHVAKSMTFEVDDKAGMDRQIAQVKKTASELEKVIESEVEKRAGATKSTMKTKYGILTPEPEDEMPADERDKADIAKGDYAKVIARRFARRGQ